MSNKKFADLCSLEYGVVSNCRIGDPELLDIIDPPRKLLLIRWVERQSATANFILYPKSEATEGNRIEYLSSREYIPSRRVFGRSAQLPPHRKF